MKKKKKQSVIIPKLTKFKKLQKGQLQPFKLKYSTTHLYFGLYGLKILKATRLDTTQLEAARRKISRELKKDEFLWIRAIPDIPITKKPNEIRMGKGKGAVAHWVSRVKAGQTIFELICLSSKKAHTLLFAAAKKLAVPCIVISNKKKVSL